MHLRRYPGVGGGTRVTRCLGKEPLQAGTDRSTHLIFASWERCEPANDDQQRNDRPKSERHLEGQRLRQGVNAGRGPNDAEMAGGSIGDQSRVPINAWETGNKCVVPKNAMGTTHLFATQARPRSHRLLVASPQLLVRRDERTQLMRAPPCQKARGGCQAAALLSTPVTYLRLSHQSLHGRHLVGGPQSGRSQTTLRSRRGKGLDEGDRRALRTSSTSPYG